MQSNEVLFFPCLSCGDDRTRCPLFLIFSEVTNGKNAMPAFGGRLSDEEIADVAAYVYNQADTGGWDS